MSGGGRRAMRDEMQATWAVWDAVRPITKQDLVEPPQPEAVPTAEPSSQPDGGTLRDVRRALRRGRLR